LGITEVPKPDGSPVEQKCILLHSWFKLFKLAEWLAKNFNTEEMEKILQGRIQSLPDEKKSKMEEAMKETLESLPEEEKDEVEGSLATKASAACLKSIQDAHSKYGRAQEFVCNKQNITDLLKDIRSGAIACGFTNKGKDDIWEAVFLKAS
jgi:hypothetical protein